MTLIHGGDSSDALKSTQSRKHVLVIALSLQAHVAGIYRLAVQLAERGVTVTFVSLAQDVARMKTYDELEGLDFRLLPYGSSFTRPKGFGSIQAIRDYIAAYEEHFQPILAELKAQQNAGLPGPTCVIHDRFCSRWVRDVAKELNVPRYMFFSCGAILARFLQELPTLFSEGTLAVKEDKTLLEFEGSLTLLGLPKLQYIDIPFSTKYDPESGLAMGQEIIDTAAVIVNTFYELEQSQIDEMRRHFAENSAGRKIPKVFLVGPLSNARTFKDRSFISGPEHRGTDSLRWLDSREPQSVLYICLGSIFLWTPPVVYELAQALEATEQDFLWVLPVSDTLPSLEEALPAGFEERTRGRGLIARGWVPQLQILAHFSVGGFLSHCGWNSIIESISSGVPLIAWPQSAEQRLNCRYLVDVLKVAVEVGHRMLVPTLIRCDEFVKLIRLLMMEEEGKAMRLVVEDLKLKAKATVEDGGPRQKAVNEIADSIPCEL